VELLGQSLLARWRQAQGETVAFPEDGYHGHYVRELATRVPADSAAQWRQLDADAAARAFGDWAVERMLEGQRADLQQFGVSYDRWFRESELHTSGEVDATLRQLQEEQHVYEQEGALFFRSTQWNDDKDRVLTRSDGTATYFLADAAYHHNKHGRGFRHVIDVWGPDHHGHIVRMQALCRAFGFPEDWLEVVIVQWVKLIEGGEAVKMSKRAGQLVSLADLVDEVGADVARYFFLMRQHSSHLDFDLALARTESDENPVYYVKYAHARICSVIEKASQAGLQLRDGAEAAAAAAAEAPPLPEDCALERLQEEAERNLLRLLLDWPGFLQRAAEAREPHRLTGFCEDLARAFHKFYHECRVIQEDRELGLARLALCHATRRVLASALALMSIEAPRSM
jgi:arginyl-tRNA synthetase